MTFASPYLLPLLVVVPAVAFFVWWLERRRARYAVAFTNLDLLASVVEHRRRRVLSFVPLALFLLALDGRVRGGRASAEDGAGDVRPRDRRPARRRLRLDARERREADAAARRRARDVALRR